MDAAIIDNSDPSELVLEVLTQHLPWSLPLLRRLQFMRGSGAKTSHSRVLSTFDKENPNREFLVASVDLSRGPETELWLYSSVENGGLPGNEAVCEKQVLRLFERVREMEKKFESRRPTPGVVLVATLHAKVLKMLEKHSMVKAKTEEHLKFIFQMGDLPEGKPLLEELAWSSVMPTDIPLVLSRTSIPYQASVYPIEEYGSLDKFHRKTMERLPSMTITTKAGKLIAWVFLGVPPPGFFQCPTADSIKRA